MKGVILDLLFGLEDSVAAERMPDVSEQTKRSLE